MSRQISSLKDEVLALRSQNSQKEAQNEAEMRELRKREAELKDKVEKWETGWIICHHFSTYMLHRFLMFHQFPS